MTHRIIIYILYFLLFAILAFFHIHFEDNAISIDLSPLDTYATLFLSVLLIDITYRIGKHQNDIAKRQNEIAEQQTALQRLQCEISEYEIYKGIHRDVYNLSKQSNLVLPMIYCYFASNTAKDQAKNVADLERVFGEIHDKLTIDMADFALRKGNSDLIEEAYLFACFVEYLLGVVGTYTKENRPEQSDVEFLNYNRMRFTSDEDHWEATKLYIPHNDILRTLVKKFLDDKKRLFEAENNLLEKIQASYKNNIS